MGGIHPRNKRQVGERLATAAFGVAYGRGGGRTAAVRAFLARGGEGNVTVPYRCNRAVVFDSNLFYETDTFDFRDAFDGWRTSLTFLYGERGRAVMSQGLGMS